MTKKKIQNTQRNINICEGWGCAAWRKVVFAGMTLTHFSKMRDLNFIGQKEPGRRREQDEGGELRVKGLGRQKNQESPRML